MYFLSFGMFYSVRSPTIYYKICADTIHNHHTTINTANISDCSDLSGNKEFEDYVQSTAALVSLKTVASILLAIPCNIILSAWGDIYGRKTILLLGVAGTGIFMFAYVFASAFVFSPFWIFYVFCFISGLSGMPQVVQMNIVTYLSDTIADRDTISFRIIVNGAVWSLGYVAGGFIASELVLYFSLATVICFALGFLLLTALYAAIVFEQKPPEDSAANHNSGQLDDAISITSKNLGTTEQGVFNPFKAIKDLFVETYHTLTRYRGGHDKRYLYVSIVAFYLYITFDQGLDAQFVYILRKPRSFTPQLTSLYTSIQALAQTVGGLITAVVMHKFNINPIPVTMMSMLFCIASLVTLSLAQTKAMVFLSTIVGTFGQVGVGSLDAFLCNLVSPMELGKLMSMIAVGYAVAPIIGTGIYNPIYSATLDFWDGFVFIVVAGVIFVGFLLVSYILIDGIIMAKRSQKSSETDVIEDDISDSTIQKF